jgi:hypothetical protein
MRLYVEEAAQESVSDQMTSGFSHAGRMRSFIHGYSTGWSVGEKWPNKRRTGGEIYDFLGPGAHSILTYNPTHTLNTSPEAVPNFTKPQLFHHDLLNQL